MSTINFEWKEDSKMHKFLRAVGFSEVKQDELEHIFKKIMEEPTSHRAAKDAEGNKFVELVKEYGPSFGISLRGTYDANNEFKMDYYYPFFEGKGISTTESVEVEKHAEKDSYAGICDEVRVGVSLIFYLQNIVDYLFVSTSRMYTGKAVGVMLSGLSTDGKILLPIHKSEKKVKNKNDNYNYDRNSLIAAARNGDEDAIENLTLEDMDTYSILSKRIMHEDILSIVDNYFMPYGIECDQYAILGEIIDYTLEKNALTEEEIYVLDLKCNDILFSICINKKDLLGEPAVGRRFKGNIWLQGSIFYSD